MLVVMLLQVRHLLSHYNIKRVGAFGDSITSTALTHLHYIILI
jgi:hypothetical protein